MPHPIVLATLMAAALALCAAVLIYLTRWVVLAAIPSVLDARARGFEAHMAEGRMALEEIRYINLGALKREADRSSSFGARVMRDFLGLSDQHQGWIALGILLLVVTAGGLISGGWATAGLLVTWTLRAWTAVPQIMPFFARRERDLLLRRNAAGRGLA